MIALEGVTVGPAGRGLDRVTFEVPAGQAAALHGPPGAGKTLTLAALLGLVPTDGGIATVLGLPYRELDRPACRVGAVLGPVAASRRTPRALLGVRAAALGRDGADVDRVCRDTGLGPAADESLAAAPANRRLLVALAGALLGRPEVLVLDAPLEHQGEADADALVALLGGLVVGGTTVLVATRRLEPLRGLVQQVVLLQDGRVSSRLSAARLADAGGAGEVVVRSPAREALEQGLRRQHYDVTADDGGLVVRDASPAAVAEVARAVDAAVDELRPVAVDLDETTTRLTRPDNGHHPAEPDPDPRSGTLLRELDARLDARIADAAPPAWIVVRGTGPGVGTSTVAGLLADLAVRLAGSDAVVLTPSSLVAADPVRRSPIGLPELLRDLPGLDEHARLRPYLSRLESGVDVLAGDPAALTARDVRILRRMTSVPGGAGATIVLDLGDAPGLPGLPADGVREVLVSADADVGAAAPAAPGTLLVLNRATTASRARFAALLGAGGHALLPDEPRLPTALLEAEDPTVAAGALARVSARALWAAVVDPQGDAR